MSNVKKQYTYIIKTSDLGYCSSFYEVVTDVTLTQLKEFEYKGVIDTSRFNSTSIEDLKFVCNQEGYIFDYRTIEKHSTGHSLKIWNLNIDYTAHYGNY